MNPTLVHARGTSQARIAQEFGLGLDIPHQRNHIGVGFMPQVRDDDPIAVGRRLLEIRLAWGYPNAREWSRFTGIKHTTYKMWEVGDRLPSLQEALVLCAKTGVSLDWIYRGLQHSNPLHVIERLEAFRRDPIEPKTRKSA